MKSVEVQKEKILRLVEFLEASIRQELKVERDFSGWLYDTDEVCRMLNISKRTLQNYRSKRMFFYVKIGFRAQYSEEIVRLLFELRKARNLVKQVRALLK